MIKIKRKLKNTLRKLYILLVTALCIFTAVFGIFKAYEQTVFTSTGQRKSAVEINGNYLRILDFEIRIK